MSRITFTDEIASGQISMVHRGRRRDGQRVVVKQLRSRHEDPAAIAQFQHELAIAEQLAQVSGVVRIHELRDHHGALSLVMDDAGVALRDVLRAGRPPLERVLVIGARIADVLGHIHDASVVHRDINPSNIAIDPASDAVTILDLALALVIRKDAPVPAGAARGALAYLAPEATGRVDRAIDHRADLYSLGATLYELLTGAPPFSTTDPGELVHAHLARQPIDPHVVDPAIPPAIGGIVMKLLAKDPEDRYQSAFGVAADLEACLAGLRTTGAVPELATARRDLRQRLVLPRVLYGREQALDQLCAGLDAVARGGVQLQLIGGYPGVGKTRLVEELRRPTIEHDGHFAAGKFDQLRNDIPYSAIARALRHVIGTLLAEPPAQLAAHRHAIGRALGTEASLVVDLLPELGVLLDITAGAGCSSLDVADQVPRLLVRLVAALAAPGRPLVLFIDDLQWSDPASRALVESLMRADDIRGLYLIGSYRDNEVAESHPLIVLRDALALEQLPIATLVLEPLGLGSVVGLLAEALGRGAGDVAELAEAVVDKTGGNPLFVRAFVDALTDAEVVQFDPVSRSWQWDIAAVRARVVTDNVVDLLVDKIARLPARARELVIAAACLGSEFDRATLGQVIELPDHELDGALGAAREAGLVLLDDTTAGALRFAHDRIQQAAYALVPETDRVATHQRFGRRLLAALSEAARDARLFELLYHLNFGFDATPRPEPAPGLLEMNVAAGRKARDRGAHAAALRHLELALALLIERAGTDAAAWNAHHGLALELHDAAVEAAFLSGELARMEQLTAIIRDRAHSVFETVRSVRVRLAAVHAQHSYGAALDLGVASLAELGVAVPRRPSKLRVVRALAGTLLRMRGRSAASLVALPRISDPRQLAVMDLINDIMFTAYMSSQELFVVLALKLVDRSLRLGNCGGSLTGYSCLAILLCGVVGDTEWGNQIADAVDAMMPEFDVAYRGRPRFALNAAVRHWKYPIRDALPGLLQASRDGIEAGKREPASMGGFLYRMFSYYLGRPLPELARDFAEYAAALSSVGDTATLSYNQRVHQSVLNLIGNGAAPWLLTGKAFDEGAAIAENVHRNDRTQLALIYIEKLMLATWFHRTEEGLVYRSEASSRLDANPGFLPVPQYHLHSALTQLAACGGPTGRARRRLIRGARRDHARLRRFAARAPHNYAHCAALVEAELCRVGGDQGGALAAYERAIQLAHDHEFLHHEAFANELAGRFHFSYGRLTAAHAYLVRARNLFVRWGALAKIRQLDAEYPELAQDRGQAGAPAPSPFAGRTTGATADLGRRLDLAAVLKASQRLSSEVVVQQLVTQLMNLVAENAGAERGFLILPRDGQWMVEAGYAPEAGGAARGAPVALDDCRELAASMVHYVVRNRTAIVLGDAACDSVFVADPYVRQRRPRSVLAVPLLRLGELAGVLYLENNQSAGAFTPDRVEILSLLSSQAAISLENARLYESLECKVAERTQKLEQLQQVALANAHHAGMAEIAAGVLHNVGNVLNSLTVSCSELDRGVRESRVHSLASVGALLEQHRKDLATFLTEDSKGKTLTEYLIALGRELEAENARAAAEIRKLHERIGLIAAVIADQQTYATGQFLVERVELSQIVQDVLGMRAPMLAAAGIRIVQHVEPIARVPVHKTKLIYVLVNVIKNAEEALVRTPIADRVITIDIGLDGAGRPFIGVRDAGEGIHPEHLGEIFVHGFTTKPTGRGFGLHTCANLMTEMDGQIVAASPGPGGGASFTLTFGVAATSLTAA